MSDVKWIKINLNMYDDEKIKLIDSMEETDTIHYIWIRLLIQAGKVNDDGYIYLNEGVPFTDEMLSVIFNRPVNILKSALSILKEYGMIQIDEENYIKITNWGKHQNVEGMERAREQSRKRMQKFREKKRNEENQEQCNVIGNEENINVTYKNLNVTQSDVTVTPQKENKIKNKIKNKKESNKTKELENEFSIVTIEEVREEKRKVEKLEVKAAKIAKFYENITGKVGIFSPNALIVAIDSYGEDYVKMAIDKALEVDKPNMNYINGILRNWAKSGYPKGGIKHGKCYITDCGEFEDFKPRKAKELSEEERKIAESRFI